MPRVEPPFQELPVAFQELPVALGVTDGGGDETGDLRASLIRTLGQFINANPDADQCAMIGALQKVDLDDLEKEARNYRRIQGGTTFGAMPAVLERHYKRLSRNGAA